MSSADSATDSRPARPAVRPRQVTAPPRVLAAVAQAARAAPDYPIASVLASADARPGRAPRLLGRVLDAWIAHLAGAIATFPARDTAVLSGLFAEMVERHAALSALRAVVQCWAEASPVPATADRSAEPAIADRAQAGSRLAAPPSPRAVEATALH